MSTLEPRLDFEVPAERIPTTPPERRGLARDGVRLLVADGTAVTHARFHELGRFLRPTDLLVVNTSTTRPAALPGHTVSGDADGRPITRHAVVHFSTRTDEGDWVVELRQPDGSGPILDAASGDVVHLAGGGHLTLGTPASAGPDGDGTRLWSARVDVPGGRVTTHLAEHGRPITYGGAPTWPLEDYQTVFARHPGSAEMPSAARPFSLTLVADLVSRGVVLAPLQLHAGVSSQEAGEAPGAERLGVGERTAALVNHTRASGGRVIAVGTTVTRALETAADATGMVRPIRGCTDLVITPSRGVRVVDGIISGWHEAVASHLQLLEAVVGPRVLAAAYRQAIDAGYHWHEFGDSALLLPER